MFADMRPCSLRQAVLSGGRGIQAPPLRPRPTIPPQDASL